MFLGVEMDKIAVVDVKPQLVLGMCKIGGYEEIAPMIQKLCEFAVTTILYDLLVRRANVTRFLFGLKQR